MKKIAYYVGLGLSALCLVIFFIPFELHSGFWTREISLFNVMIEAYQMEDELFYAIFVTVIIVFSILALLFVAIKKQVPAIIFAALAGVLVLTLNLGVLRILFVILSILLIASQICYMVFDKKEAAVNVTVSQANDASNQNNNF